MTRQSEIAKYLEAYCLSSYRMGDARRDLARQTLRSLPVRGSLLDVGTGRGELLDDASGLGFDPVRGTEVVPYLLSERVTYAEAHALPHDAGAFDVVTCLDVLEHLDPGDTVRALEELSRVAARAVVVTAADYSHVVEGVELHVNARPLDEWDALVRACIAGRVTRVAAAAWTVIKES